MTASDGENLSDVRLHETIKHIEQVISVAIAISCYFRLFGFRYGLTLADNFSEQPTGDS